MGDSSVSRTRLWLDALRGFYRHQVPIEQLDAVSRWLYAGRLLILVISAQAAVIAGLLAATNGSIHPLWVIPLLLGFVIAHAISNLSNDYFGFIRGHDTPDSPRVRYTIHPLAHKVVRKEALRGALWLLGGVAALIGLFFILERGLIAAILFVAGIAILYLYDAAPTSLKAIGLGEFAAFLVWGPLMIGGGYYCLTGQISGSAIVAGIPYGLGIASILGGKHLDQASFDREHSLRTLPVLLGERWSRIANQVSVVLMYLLIIALVAARRLTPFALLVLLNAPSAWRLIRACSDPRPEEPPKGYVGWPLWFHRFNLVHNRRYGWLYIIGLLLGDVWALVVVPLLHG